MRDLVEYGLANAAAATLLALVAVLIGLVVRRPAVRNALWVLVLVRLLLPPVWTVTVTVPAPGPTAGPDALAPTPIETAPGPTVLVPVADQWTGDEVAAGEVASSPPAPVAAPANVPAESPAPISAFTFVGAVWFGGTAFVFVRSARRIVQFRRALRDSVPAPVHIQHQADRLARTMDLRRCPAVRIVPGRVSPALWMPGFRAGHATLILPAGLLPLLDARQREAVLAHELAHLRRGDPWVRWLELVVGGLYWWHPLLGWFRRELRAAEEECCDLRVVAALGERRDYATALVETAAFLGESGPVPALVSGAGPVRHLQRRVTMIMRATWPAKLTRLGLAAVLAVGGLGLAFGPALAQDRERKDGDRKDGEPRKERVGGDERKDRPAPPREGERGRDRAPEAGDRESIEKARVAVERARKVAQEAMEQVRAAEEALARAEGRPVPPRDRFERRDGDRRPDAPPPSPLGRPGVPAPPAPIAPAFPRRPGVEGNDLRDLQMQIEELRRALEQMRQELRRGERGERKDPGPREGRPDRPKDEPKRPVREPDRADFGR